MLKKIRVLWPFLWLLCAWLYVVIPLFSNAMDIDWGKSNQVFTVLLALHAGVYALIFSRLLPLRWFWLSIIMQDGLIIVMSLVLSPANTLMISMALYLGLVAVGVNCKPGRDLVTFTVLSASLSFILGSTLREGWIAFHHAILYVAPVTLVATGYIVLYFRMAGSNEQTRTLLRELETAHTELADYAVRVEDLTLANERQRMARELHDTLAQGLVGLSMQLDTVDALLTEQNCREAQEIVQQAMQRARSTLATARCAIDDLRSETFGHLTCAEAVQEELRRFSSATGIWCHADLKELATIAPDKREHIQRIITEGLMNIARHAQARQAWIRIVRQADNFVLDISDDGIGFEPDTVAVQAGHYGLLGLRERARLLGGKMEIKSVPNKGTTIRCSFQSCEDERGPCVDLASVASVIQKGSSYE